MGEFSKDVEINEIKLQIWGFSSIGTKLIKINKGSSVWTVDKWDGDNDDRNEVDNGMEMVMVNGGADEGGDCDNDGRDGGGEGRGSDNDGSGIDRCGDSS